MNPTADGATTDQDADEGHGEPEVPEGVIEGITEVINGEFATKDDLEDALDF